MSVRRFTGTTQREAMRQVRDSLGEDAVIVSSRKTAQGAEVFAIAEAELDAVGTDTPARAQANGNAPEFAALAQQLLAEVQDMRSMMHEQTGTKMPIDNRRRLYRKLRAGGYSDELARQLVALLPGHLNQSETQFAAALDWLQQQLITRIAAPDAELDILNQQGVLALVGPTGVGKTTTTAKLAANYVMKHGNDNLLLVTTDSYRIGAQQQLAIYAELLDVQMHALADGDSLAAVADKIKGKRLVLVDTVGMSQRDQNLARRLAALRSNKRDDSTRIMLLLNSASQQQNLDEVARIYQGIASESALRINDVILTKLDEAAQLGGVLDTVIRYKFAVQACSGGQRVPEDLVAADLRTMVSESLAVAETESVYSGDDWEQQLPQNFSSGQLFSHSRVIRSVVETLRKQVPGFGLVESVWRHQQLPQPESDPHQGCALIRWAAPQALQGWQQLTPHLQLSQSGLPVLPPYLQSAEVNLTIGADSAPAQLFDYLPEAALLDVFDQEGTGWLATLNLNHRLLVEGKRLPVVAIVKEQAVPLSRARIEYRGERRELVVKVAAVDSLQSKHPLQLVYGELHGGTNKNPVQRRYWLVDGQCSAEQLGERIRYALQLEEYGRLTRLAWQQLDKLIAPQDEQAQRQALQLWLAGAIAAAAVHIEYAQAPECASVRGELLSLTGKRGRVQGDKLVSGILHALQGYESLQAAGRELAS
ncbi:flagellar biosynthesis protein FlhF [Pseudidiomarina sp.]|uniref:flagellar biosynthesis protein FlhF n=1 Tax=Pseudidiomarina sp. TaxID=2081707 RepID=UPI00299CF7CF|nr:flagellar biosynthesis protein FlhF [Pseudidiomarina sp.]MDX1705739.1 flagellar biosynthesis protein FlhF [Pseudidiomarina sp.]